MINNNNLPPQVIINSGLKIIENGKVIKEIINPITENTIQTAKKTPAIAKIGTRNGNIGKNGSDKIPSKTRDNFFITRAIFFQKLPLW